MNSSILNQIGNTPLVPLTRVSADLPANAPVVLGKCEHLNPGGSIKDRIARAIIEDAEQSGQLRPGGTLVEATAGNTGVGLALMAAVRGYRLVCVLPEKMSVDKRNALANLGAEVLVTPNAPPHDPRNFQNVARQLAQQNGWFLTEQFQHHANPRIHESCTGPELWRQTGGVLGAVVAGAGTGGTLTGVGRFLRRVSPQTRIILADPIGSRLAHRVNPRHPDHDAPYLIEGIGGSVVPGNLDLTVVHDAEPVSDAESFAMTGRLWREEGLLVGGSSGTAVVAALRVAARLAESVGQSDERVGPVIAILADSWDRYPGQAWMKQLLQSGGSIGPWIPRE